MKHIAINLNPTNFQKDCIALESAALELDKITANCLEYIGTNIALEAESVGSSIKSRLVSIYERLKEFFKSGFIKFMGVLKNIGAYFKSAMARVGVIRADIMKVVLGKSKKNDQEYLKAGQALVDKSFNDGQRRLINFVCNSGGLAELENALKVFDEICTEIQHLELNAITVQALGNPKSLEKIQQRVEEGVEKINKLCSVIEMLRLDLSEVSTEVSFVTMITKMDSAKLTGFINNSGNQNSNLIDKLERSYSSFNGAANEFGKIAKHYSQVADDDSSGYLDAMINTANTINTATTRVLSASQKMAGTMSSIVVNAIAIYKFYTQDLDKLNNSLLGNK